MSLFAITALTLVPVAIDDPFLERPETFVSADARSVQTAGETQSIFCLTLDKVRAGVDNVCLSRDEWNRVNEAARTNALGQQASRHGTQSLFRANRPTSR